MQSRGIVHLIGAGPGDPGLLTLRGRDLLAAAHVVVYDALANPKLLELCPQAELIYVGKRGPEHALPQEQINALLIERARRGQRVARLKGGDPYVFGRGGEEAAALAAAGVSFEVVPGVTAAIAAANTAGFPVTHRDFNSSFTIITGHEKEDSSAPGAAAASDIDWSVLAKLPCLAFYMGVSSLPRICKNLIDHGMSRDTPAATIQWATTPRQRTVVAALGDLPQKVAAAGLGAPAITLVGKVVSLRESLNWFESRPLFGQTIVVTRTRQQASELSRRLEELGAEVIEAPTLELHPAPDESAVDEALTSASNYDWIIFTSVNGVRFAKQRLLHMNRDVREFGSARIAAIGDATARAIVEELGLIVNVCPENFVAEALAEALIQRGQVAGKRFLLLRADVARPVLREKLLEAGAADVLDMPIYQSRPAVSLPPALLDALAEKRVDWITFASGGTAKNFAALLGPDFRQKLAGIKLASIGPITSQTMQELGLTPTIQADKFNIDGLVEKLAGHRE